MRSLPATLARYYICACAICHAARHCARSVSTETIVCRFALVRCSQTLPRDIGCPTAPGRREQLVCAVPCRVQHRSALHTLVQATVAVHSSTAAVHSAVFARSNDDILIAANSQQHASSTP